MTRLRFVAMKTESVVKYEGKSDDYGNPYTEELVSFSFEDAEGKSIDLVIEENNLHLIVENLKIFNHT